MTSLHRNRKRAGGTLIEILVVIVVFLVGILAIAQIFPVGLGVLRTTRNNTVAATLGRAELERLKGQSEQLAEQIQPVRYLYQGGVLNIVTDPNRLRNELMPSNDRRWTLDLAGDVYDENGVNRGNWSRVSGANLFSRVIGEGRRAPAPRFIGLGGASEYGGLLPLQFAPVYYSRTGNLTGNAGVLEVYGNDLQRRVGNRQADNPSPTGGFQFNPYTYYFVDGDDTEQGEPFQGKDQLWLPRPSDPNKAIKYRIAFNFAIVEGQRVNTYDVIYPVVLDPNAQPVYAETRPSWRYWVVSLPGLVGQPDGFGDVRYPESNYYGTDYWSLRTSRSYVEIPPAQAFDNGDPYEFKVYSGNLGFLVVNPIAFNTVINKPRGREPLQARVDYTVFDWRIIRDEFRVPTNLPLQQKLVLRNLKAKGNRGPDQLAYPGLGLPVPDGSGGLAEFDVVLVDLETGGVILGNRPFQAGQESYTVDKSNGVISFRDVDGDPSNGLSAYLVFPSQDADGWDDTPALVPDIRGRSVRALYQATGEWSAQALKAAMLYRVTVIAGPSRIQSGECYVGGSNANGEGDPTRLYFPWSDLGNKVVIGQAWYLDPGGNVRSIQDQEFQIKTDANNAFGLPYADLRDKDPNARGWDYSNGYAVRRVRGASVRVRVLWNPEGFILTNDTSANYNQALERWSRGWRRVETETFLTGGQY